MPNKIIAIIEEQYNANVTVLRIETVGPTISNEVTQKAALAVVVAALIIIIYIVEPQFIINCSESWVFKQNQNEQV